MKNIEKEKLKKEYLKLLKKIEKTNKNKIENDFFLEEFYFFLKQKLFNKFFKKEKELQKYLKKEIEKWLISLEEYNTIIKENILINKKRIDLSFSLLNKNYGIELKNGLNSSSLRNLEFQINEYIEGIIFSKIIIILKIKKQDTFLNALKYKGLINRLISNKKIILIVT